MPLRSAEWKKGFEAAFPQRKPSCSMLSDDWCTAYAAEVINTGPEASNRKVMPLMCGKYGADVSTS